MLNHHEKTERVANFSTTAPPNEAPAVLTLAEACLLLRISRPTMFSLLQQHKIPAKKVGRNWRFERGQLISWLQGNVAARIHGDKR